MSQPPGAPPVLAPEPAARVAEFARSCKAAARAVSLYPAAHPAIASSLARLAQATAKLTESGPARLQVRGVALLLDGAPMPRPDAAIAEFAEVLGRHLIGSLTINAGADTDAWRTLLLLLARSSEEVRADGGIGRLWATAGGHSLEIQEIDYAEVLREKQGLAGTIDQILAAALAGPQVQLDESAVRALAEIVGDPARLDELMAQLDAAGDDEGSAKASAFVNLLRGLADHIGRTDPERLDTVFRQMGHAAGRLSAGGMVSLLAQRQQPSAMCGSINVVGAVTERMTDATVAQFVAGSVAAHHGATDRLAHAFQALVPEMDRRRQLLSLAEEEVAATALGQEESFTELWERVEHMLTWYTDANFVSDEYGRELSNARSSPVPVEHTSDDPPDRVAAWLASVNDSTLRKLDQLLLHDLLVLEEDPTRWRDIALTAIAHAEDLVRVGYFDQAWLLAETVGSQSQTRADRQEHGRAALERFAGGTLMKHVAAHLRAADDAAYERFKRLCHGISTPIVAPLAEALSSEQDSRARRRLRDILVGFGAQGREVVQQLMNAPNWEVRRTAAFLLREFGGEEGLRELVPLLTDAEPLVQREAIQGLVLHGSDQASAILLTALAGTNARTRQSITSELISMRDDRAAPLFCYLLRHADRRALSQVYLTSIEALGSFGGEGAAEALAFALHRGGWRTPFLTRRIRGAAAGALRRIGTAAALDALRDASTRGTRGVRAAARAELRLLS